MHANNPAAPRRSNRKTSSMRSAILRRARRRSPGRRSSSTAVSDSWRWSATSSSLAVESGRDRGSSARHGPRAAQGAIGADHPRFARGRCRHRLSRVRSRHAATPAGDGRDLAGPSSARPPATTRPKRGIMISSAPEVEELAGARRYNLQETLAHAIFERIAAFHGVREVRIAHVKARHLSRRQRSRRGNRFLFRGLACKLGQTCLADAVSGLSVSGTKSVARPLSHG